MPLGGPLFSGHSLPSSKCTFVSHITFSTLSNQDRESYNQPFDNFSARNEFASYGGEAPISRHICNKHDNPPFFNLPTGILAKIFNYITPDDSFCAALTCKHLWPIYRIECKEISFFDPRQLCDADGGPAWAISINLPYPLSHRLMDFMAPSY